MERWGVISLIISGSCLVSQPAPLDTVNVNIGLGALARSGPQKPKVAVTVAKEPGQIKSVPNARPKNKKRTRSGDGKFARESKNRAGNASQNGKENKIKNNKNKDGSTTPIKVYSDSDDDNSFTNEMFDTDSSEDWTTLPRPTPGERSSQNGIPGSTMVRSGNAEILRESQNINPSRNGKETKINSNKNRDGSTSPIKVYSDSDDDNSFTNEMFDTDSSEDWTTLPRPTPGERSSPNGILGSTIVRSGMQEIGNSRFGALNRGGSFQNRIPGNTMARSGNEINTNGRFGVDKSENWNIVNRGGSFQNRIQDNTMARSGDEINTNGRFGVDMSKNWNIVNRGRSSQDGIPGSIMGRSGNGEMYEETNFPMNRILVSNGRSTQNKDGIPGLKPGEKYKVLPNMKRVISKGEGVELIEKSS